MQEALDPNFGQSEIKERKKEIHIMELRLEELRKKQEFLIKEIERAVYKRENIQLKYSNKEKVNKKRSKGMTKPKIKRHIQTLKNTLQQTTANSKQYSKVSKKKNSEMQQL